MDLLLPDVRVAKISPQLMDNTGRFSSPLSGTVRSVARPGDRWSFQLDYQNLQGLDRARLESFIANMRGAANRALYSPGDYVQRGSFPSAEALTNNSFANGTTGWACDGDYSLSSADRVIRALRIAVASGTNAALKQSVTPTQYAPYALRLIRRTGRGNFVSQDLADSIDIGFLSSPISDGISSAAYVTLTNGARNIELFDSASSGQSMGDYIEVPWVSYARCALVDGAPNLLLHSDTPGGTSWSVTNSTAAVNGSAAPDGTATAYYLAETTANGLHYASQGTAGLSSSVADYSYSIFVAPNLRNWCWLQMTETTGGGAVSCFFNISTGAIGTSSVGSNWSNVRASAVNYGNGWWRFIITARKTNSATGINVYVGAATANGTNSYTGSTSPVALLTWRGSLAQSSAPLAPTQTITTAIPAISPTGNSVYVKGLPANTNGLLLTGDWFEINKELKRATASLNSDAAGLGYLQFSPPLRNPPNDNDPVIINMPMGRFTLKNPANGWASTPLYFASSSLVLEEAA